MRAVLSKPSSVGRGRDTVGSRINGVVIGKLTGYNEDAKALVVYPGMPSTEPLAAITTEDLSAQQSDHEVALGFVNGDPSLPIVLGLIQHPDLGKQVDENAHGDRKAVNVKVDGETVTLSADKEIVLRCGKSSITLTRAGKVIIKGAYLTNHSTGVNRIKGGSVQIN
ncbi:MAG: DUF2345 domain-containing protein [Gammaproteobacteria bacterium]|nr:DUF2345 domain-containing protein [Gammaproteobacteria bacterium]